MLEIYLQPLRPDGAGGGIGNIIADEFPYIIGRWRECDLRISDPCVSRRHCELFAQGDHVWVRDLDSLNGTFINEAQVLEPLPLGDGDMLRVAFVAFKVRIPAATDDRTIAQAKTDETQAIQRRRVLVVEDDVNAAESLALVLKNWGCQVHVAHDGSEAVRSAQAHPPDTVLLDLCLPGMDGYQVARRLRDEAGLADARMVAMTGRPEAADRRNPRDAGVQKLLIKPVGAEVLRQAIAGC